MKLTVFLVRRVELLDFCNTFVKQEYSLSFVLLYHPHINKHALRIVPHTFIAARVLYARLAHGIFDLCNAYHVLVGHLALNS